MPEQKTVFRSGQCTETKRFSNLPWCLVSTWRTTTSIINPTATPGRQKNSSMQIPPPYSLSDVSTSKLQSVGSGRRILLYITYWLIAIIDRPRHDGERSRGGIPLSATDSGTMSCRMAKIAAVLPLHHLPCSCLIRFGSWR